MEKSLHPWNVSIQNAIQIQEALRQRIVLQKTSTEVRTIGGGDVAYSKEGDRLFGAVAVFTFPELEEVDSAQASGKITFPYIPGLFSFREGPILIKAFRKLKIKPDVMIFEGQGIAHPRGFGLASHLGLCLDLPSIGCAKTRLAGPGLCEPGFPGPAKGSFELIRREGKEIGAVLRTRNNVRPLFVSPGHRIDLQTSIDLILATCRAYRIPESLRRAHQLATSLRAETNLINAHRAVTPQSRL